MQLGDTPHITGGFLDGLQVVVVLRQLFDVLGKEVGLIGRWIVVQHARQVGGVDHSADVCLHFAPIRRVDVRRQDHETLAANFAGIPCQLAGLCRGQRGDSRNDRCRVAGCCHTRLQDGDLLVVSQRGSFPQRAQRDDADATAVEHQAHVFAEGLMVHIQ